MKVVDKSREQAEGLRESEERIRREKEFTLSLIKGLADGFAMVDQEGKQIRVNDELCKMTGFSEQELLGQKPPFKYWAEEGMKDINEAFEKTLKGAEGEYELIFRRKDGARFTALVSPRTITDPDGNTIFFATVRDITERKKAEEAVKRAAKEWRVTFDSIAELVSIHDRDFRLVRVNKAFADAVKKAPKELIGRHCYEVVHCTDKPMPDCPHMKTLEIGESAMAEFFEPCLGIHIEVSTSPVFSGEGEIVASVHVVRDITERKQAENRIAESEEMYRCLLELGGQVGEAIVMMQDTAQGEAIQTYVSDEWARITGYSKEELLGRPFFSFIHPKHWAASEDRHRRRMAGESIPGFFEMSVVRRDGSEVPIELTSAYTTYKGERANVAYIRDITARKWMEEQLITADRLASIGVLASGVAHELNNPLTGIIGFSELLMEKGVPDDIKEDIAIIHHEALRTAEVIKNLLAFGRKRAPLKQPVNVNSVIARVLGLRAYEQKVNNIRVDTRFAHDLPEALADSFQLQQVFLNIIINAEYFMTEAHKGGTLTITTERVGDMVRASFADDGPGISEESLKHLFDPFFTTKEVGKGTGLGLSICHGTVTEHGGKIYAESELGKGATFFVELPVATADEKGAAK